MSMLQFLVIIFPVGGMAAGILIGLKSKSLLIGTVGAIIGAVLGYVGGIYYGKFIMWLATRVTRKQNTEVAKKESECCWEK
jgi:membrane protein DedA with SNARE-associated domain